MMPRRPFPAFLAILFAAFQGISSAKPAFPRDRDIARSAKRLLAADFLFYERGVMGGTMAVLPFLANVLRWQRGQLPSGDERNRESAADRARRFPDDRPRMERQFRP